LYGQLTTCSHDGFGERTAQSHQAYGIIVCEDSKMKTQFLSRTRSPPGGKLCPHPLQLFTTGLVACLTASASKENPAITDTRV
jgi:hypothetical protein